MPAGKLDLRSGKSSDACRTDGHSRPLVGCCDDQLCASALLPDSDEDESEDDVQSPAFAIRDAGGINLAISLFFFPVRSSPLAAHFSSWRPPLRC
jgi:hypothetical protein